jgi:hypothetical protein
MSKLCDQLLFECALQQVGLGVDYREHNVNYNYFAQGKVSIIKTLVDDFCGERIVETKAVDYYPQSMVVYPPRSKNRWRDLSPVNRASRSFVKSVFQ